jgi:hypothetical protein
MIMHTATSMPTLMRIIVTLTIITAIRTVRSPQN